MKYAFMSFSCPQLSLDETFSLAARLGYDGIEPRIDAEHNHKIEVDTSGEERKEIRKKAEDSGIAICCIATPCKYADPETAGQQAEDTLRRIDLAVDVGSPRIRVFGGSIPDGVSRERATAGLIESLGSVANHAAERSVTVCVETHDSWCDPEHLANVIRQVGHSAIAVNWDIMHPVRSAGSTMDNAFEILKPWIRHVHFHDGLVAGNLDEIPIMKPIGEGDIDHRRAIELLKSLPYDGFLSGEWIKWEPAETHLPRELATMKRFEAEVAKGSEPRR